MNYDTIISEFKTLARSFIGAVAAAAAIAAMNWLGAHIPSLVQQLSLVAGGYGVLKYTA